MRSSSFHKKKYDIVKGLNTKRRACIWKRGQFYSYTNNPFFLLCVQECNDKIGKLLN